MTDRLAAAAARRAARRLAGQPVVTPDVDITFWRGPVESFGVTEQWAVSIDRHAVDVADSTLVSAYDRQFDTLDEAYAWAHRWCVDRAVIGRADFGFHLIDDQ